MDSSTTVYSEGMATPSGPNSPILSRHHAMNYYGQAASSPTPSSMCPKTLTSVTHLVDALLQVAKTRNADVTVNARTTVMSLLQHRKFLPPKDSFDNREVLVGRYIVDNIRQVATLSPETTLIESLLLLNFDLNAFVDNIQGNLTTAKTEHHFVSAAIPDAQSPVDYASCLASAALKYRDSSREATEDKIRIQEDLRECQQALQRAQRNSLLTTTTPTTTTTTIHHQQPTSFRSQQPTTRGLHARVHSMTTRGRSTTPTDTAAVEQPTKSDGTTPQEVGGGDDDDDVPGPASTADHQDGIQVLESEVSRLTADVAVAEKTLRDIQYAIEKEADSMFSDLTSHREHLAHERRMKLTKKATLASSVSEMESVFALANTYMVVIKSITESIKSQVLSTCPTLVTSLDQSVVIPLTGDEVHQPFTNGHLPGIYALLKDKFYRSTAMDFFKELRTTVQLRMSTNNLQDGIALVDNVLATWFKLDYWKKLTPDAFSCMLLLNVLPDSLEPIRTAGMEHLLEHMEELERNNNGKPSGADSSAPMSNSPDAAPRLLQYSMLKEKLKLLVTSRTSPHATTTMSVSGVADAKPQYNNQYKGNRNNRAPQQAYATGPVPSAGSANTPSNASNRVLTKGVPSLSCQASRSFNYYHILDNDVQQPYSSLMEPCRFCANPAAGKVHDPPCNPAKCNKCELYGHTKAFCAQMPTHTRAEISKRKAEAAASTNNTKQT
eukprot:gene28793-34759_t